MLCIIFSFLVIQFNVYQYATNKIKKKTTTTMEQLQNYIWLLTTAFLSLFIDTYFFYLVIKLIWRQVPCDIALL